MAQSWDPTMIHVLDKGVCICGLIFCVYLFPTLLTLGAHAQRGLRYLVCPSVCLTDLNSGTTGNKAARVRYTRLQRNNRSKNNVADLAKTAEFWQEKPAPPWTKFRDPTHQLSRCACVFIQGRSQDMRGGFPASIAHAQNFHVQRAASVKCKKIENCEK